jgi:EmrB/QacA subfamily drug resistance transporter
MKARQSSMFTHHFAHAQQHAASAAKADPAQGVVLPFLAMGLGVVILAQDFSSVNVALPAIERDLNSELSTVQWVINAYALVFAMLIVAGGRFADLFGRKRIFFIGATIFAVMSLVGGFAPNVLVLIGARAVMGIGGALMWPAILGMTYGIVPKEKAGLAGGLILGAAGVGQAIGPILGGALTELVSWRWTLFVNVPIAAFAMLVTFFKIHPALPPSVDSKIDWIGIAALSLGLLTLLFGLDQAVEWGWTDPRLLGLLVFAAVMLALFIVVERRAGAQALVPGEMMQRRTFTAACIATGLLAPIFTASLLYIPQYLQKLLGASPLNAGLGMLPMMVLFAGVSFVGGTLYDRFGARTMVAGGALLMALGAAALGLLSPASGYGVLLIGGMILLGIGLGMFYSSVTTAAVSSVDASRTSLAGGLIYMFQIGGGAVGLGLTTTVVTLTADARLRDEIAGIGVTVTDAQRFAMQGLLAGTETAQQVLRQFDAATASRILDAANGAFVAGIANGFFLGAALAIAGFVVALVFLRVEK